MGCIPLRQRYWKIRSVFHRLTEIFGIASGGGRLISVGIFRPKFAVPSLTNWFFALIREFGKRMKKNKSHSYWLARFNRKMSFPRVFPLICDQSVWHNEKMKVMNDHRSKFSNLSSWKEKPEKNQGFNGIRTHDLRDTGAMLYQLSYEATHWERGQLIDFMSSREE